MSRQRAVRSPAFVIAGHSALKTRIRALGRLLSMRDITIARAECFAKQGCSRCLFSSCSALLSTDKSGNPRDAARADFPFASQGLRATARRQVVAGRLFFPVIYREKQGPGGPAPTLPSPHCTPPPPRP